MPIPTPKSMAEVHLPIETYLLDYEHQGKLEVLYSRMRDQCVRDKGFTPPATSVSGERAVGRYVRLWRYYDTRRYAISDAATAREYGYHLPPFTRGSKPISLGSLSKALRNAMLDCGGKAAKRQSVSVGEDKSGFEELATNLRAEDFTHSQSDPRVRDVFRNWSACMAQKGYHYPTPVDAAKDGQWKDSGQRTPEALKAEVTPRETRTAVAEVECVHETNLLGVSFAVEAEYENKDIEKNAEALNKLKARNERAAQKIDELWAQSG
ncbi:hypothetical protein FRZ03_09605 [Streptomyces misionensis]|uniref:Uncharacterized protein n=1 Tax=Streptomyces misionensis TaxID=67331 RepID=A0A5C6JWC0_9ACTN|nr:hypothetical protein [Streptomyces misionensis]TWV53592.1 hypothetical protein FRZ03_09605 [Streptomyces misionensis]